MKKTLIALTLASLSAAAFADVTIYGNIRAGLYGHSTKINDGAGRQSVNTIDDFGSYVGFKGNEEVAGGLKAIWQVETALFSDKAAPEQGAWATRDTFIGLEGGFGKVRAGYVSSQFGDMGTVDAWEYTGKTADGERTANGLDIFTRTDVRLANAVRYDSPTWGGFNFNVTHGLDESRRNRNNNATKFLTVNGTTYSYQNGGNASQTVLGLNYENAGWFAQYGFGFYKDAYIGKNAKMKDGQAHRIEVGYNANNLLVDLGWQYTKGFTSRNQVAEKNLYMGGTDVEFFKGHELALTAAYTFGALTPKVTYAHGFKVKDVWEGNKIDNSAYDQVIVGLDYAMSKRTTAMFSVGYLSEGEGRKAFSTGSTAKDVRNDKTKTMSYGVGLRHLF